MGAESSGLLSWSPDVAALGSTPAGWEKVFVVPGRSTACSDRDGKICFLCVLNQRRSQWWHGPLADPSFGALLIPASAKTITCSTRVHIDLSHCTHAYIQAQSFHAKGGHLLG